jgi:methylenetetrahydrofolate--tRNA-(uracil-5-)-methyltransferase
MFDADVTVIGGGLAGCEAAWRLAGRGLTVELHEMKPERYSPAHTSPHLAELVCSNSLRSNDPQSAVGLLKEEMRALDSLIMAAAEASRVPAGKALAVDRNAFSSWITSRLERLPRVRIVRGERMNLSFPGPTILATGPLTSEWMSQALSGLVGAEHLYFYDAIAPIITAESVDMSRAFVASRYGPTGEGDYINCPLDAEEYKAFYLALLNAPKVQLRDFEKPVFFEGCLPIEVMAERGEQTLAFGPMKPVGLTDPRTGRRPEAVVQLRRENSAGTLLNMVGFQTRLKWAEQDRVFRLIPGLKEAEFVRYGSVHRNTFINAPEHVTQYLQLRQRPDLFVAGQISGVEGYVESAAMGILAGENAARLAKNLPLVTPPKTTALGALVGHLTDTVVRRFQPANINFGLVPPAPKNVRKRDRTAWFVNRAREDLASWIVEVNRGF